MSGRLARALRQRPSTRSSSVACWSTTPRSRGTGRSTGRTARSAPPSPMFSATRLACPSSRLIPYPSRSPTSRRLPVGLPNTRTGYHGFTFGILVDELVRRATGQSFDDVARDLVTGPLGIADSLVFSVTERHRDRLAVLVDEKGAEEALRSIPADSPLLLMGPPAVWPQASLGNRLDFQTASIPSGVTTTARALARLYAALSTGGELGGVRILARETLARATALQTADVDQIVGFPYPKALGYNLGSAGPSLLG